MTPWDREPGNEDKRTREINGIRGISIHMTPRDKRMRG